MYIDAHWDRNQDKILISERHSDGSRHTNILSPVFEFYYESPTGTHRAITGELANKVVCKSYREFKREVKEKSDYQLFESDHDIVFKTLNRYYNANETPEPHISMIDIEVDFDKERGHANPDDPFLPITAVTVLNMWEDVMYTFAVPPEGMEWEEAEKEIEGIDNTFLVTEKELLEAFLTVIEDADVLSGWFSEGYDMPYIIGRIVRVFDKHELTKLCLWGYMPKERVFKGNFGTKIVSYNLIGRIHLDYLELYKKFSQKNQESYTLDWIGQAEVDESKVTYEGSLDKLYNQDFRKFVLYNRQDVGILGKLDKKLKYIELVFRISHANLVTVQSTMGSVAWLDQSIINKAHELGMIVKDKVYKEDSITAAGAKVADPAKGLKKYIASIDIRSLYPSTIRSLNMSPETLVGQIRLDKTMAELNRIVEENNLYDSKTKQPRYTEAWHHFYATIEYEMVKQRHPDTIIVDFEDGETYEMPAAELHDMIYAEDSPFCLSANGTIFRTDFDGVIPQLLTEWYQNRALTKSLSKELKKIATDGIKIDI